ncbi:MAG: CBS domain-containing protein [Pseudohongiellaceae bacterium]
MSVDESSLALAFIEAQPDAAARVLEQHPLEEVAAFLPEVPGHLHIRLIQRMLPQYVSRLCRLLAAPESARMLTHVELSFSAAVLRYLPAHDRNRVLAALPTNRRAALSLLLGYSEETVGAWLTPLVVTIPVDYTVAEALHQVKVSGDVVHSDHMFVVDRDRHLRGRISYLELLRADPGLNVSSLLHASCHTLIGQMSLLKAAEHRDWETLDVMPVNNRQQQFIGVLRHVDLRKGLELLKTSMSGESGTDPVAGIFEVYGNSLVALFHSLGDVIDSDPKK